jgi:hypothetical protein
MTSIKTLWVTAPVILALLASLAAAQNSGVPTPGEAAMALGFTDQDIRKIEGGEVISKRLNEGSDKELAGVVAAYFKKPVGDVAGFAFEGKLLETERDVQFHTWKPEDSADDAFASLGLGADDTSEAKRFAKAAPGDKLNLSTSDIALFKNVRATPDAVNVPLRAMLKARYAVYLKDGLRGIAPYTRGRNQSSPSEELKLAIHETTPVAPRSDFFKALLSYPADQPANVEHKFYWFKQTTEDRPTFVLAHVATRRSDNAAVITEEQFYVSHSYNSNFIAGGGLSVEGGTLVFYVNRTFTDQVAGFAAGTKHGIGRGRMLDEVTAKLKRMREELQK